MKDLTIFYLICVLHLRFCFGSISILSQRFQETDVVLFCFNGVGFNVSFAASAL